LFSFILTERKDYFLKVKNLRNLFLVYLEINKLTNDVQESFQYGYSMVKFLSEELINKLIEFKRSTKLISIMTGAGISAASGIPTFRSGDGFWVVGSKNYTPQEIATLEMFRKNPVAVWEWYIYRKTQIMNAKPNEGHFALVRLEKKFANRFYIITQNIDGLHQKAGNSVAKILPIHGTFDSMRCAELCSSELFPFPNIKLTRNENILENEIKLLKCPNCGEFARPNILWFDEFYNELFYKLDTALSVIENSGLLIIAGTSGSTNLPTTIAHNAIKKGILVIDINIEENYFSKILDNYENGFSIKGESSLVLNEISYFFETE
jgi:NAD-dependent deacetylase